MAALGSQSIASSYEQLLHVDADGGGNSTTHVSVKDGDNGTTFGFTIASDALMMSSTNRLEFGDTGTYIHQSADGVLDLVSDTEIEINATTIDINGAVEISGNTTFAGNITGLQGLFSKDDTTPAGTPDGEADDLVVGSTDTAQTGIQFFGSGGNHLYFGNADSSTIGRIDYLHSDNSMRLFTNSSQAMTIDSAGQVFIGDTANANMTQGLTINQGAADNEILALKSSDCAHGMTTIAETDTFTMIKKAAGSGGCELTVLDDEVVNPFIIQSYAGGTNTTKGTGGAGTLDIRCARADGTGLQSLASDGNLVSIRDNTNTRFLFDVEGSFHADVESTTYDAYNDAHLVRAYDLSHGKGMIESKFDEFINYNHETLADLKLVGRDEDGTPNRMINVTGMQHLHNGAIWQQYTEMQKMKELMYDTMVEMLGKEKADQKLTDHDVKLLDNKTLLN